MRVQFICAFIAAIPGGIFSFLCWPFPFFSGGLALSLFLRFERDLLITYRGALRLGIVCGLLTALFSVIFMLFLGTQMLNLMEMLPGAGNATLHGLYQRWPSSMSIFQTLLFLSVLCAAEGGMGAILALGLIFPERYRTYFHIPKR